MIIIDAFLNDNKVKDKIYNEPVEIKLSKESFSMRPRLRVGNHLSYAISFARCVFNDEVSISSDEGFIGKKTILFSGCIINSLNTSLIYSENISISLFSCYSRFVSRNKIPIEIKINNCFGNYFFDNCKIVEISYTLDNIYPRIWKTISEKHKNIFALKTIYSFENVEEISFYSNLRDKEEKKGGLLLSKYNIQKYTRLEYYPSQEELNLLDISLTINYNVNHKKTLISSLIFQNLTLKGKAGGEVKVENTKIQNVYMHNFSPTDEFKFYQIEPIDKKGKFEIHESILDNTWFDNVKLNKYDTISFFRSSLSITKFTSTVFPSSSTDFKSFQSLENIHYPDEKPDSYYRDQYEVFLQLRLALLKTGNTYEAQRMQRIAFNALEKVKGLSFWNEKLILCMNKLSNAHGFVPWRAFGWILAFSIIFYLSYLYSLGFLFLDTSFDYNFIGYYFSFLDITHKSNFLVNKEKLNGVAIFIDFINKIVLGYFIYQFVTAFRKFGRK